MTYVWRERFKFLFMLIKLLIAKMLPKKEPDTWIICERGTDARDNGYHFVKWCVKEHPEQKVAYIITKDSADRERIEELGCEIIDYGSFRHYRAMVSARMLISTHVFGFATHKYYFAKVDQKFPKLIGGKKINIQHGICQCDIESMHKDRLNTDLILLGVEAERKYLRGFGYDDDELLLTGLCRYDRLRTAESPKRQILVMPSWRQWLKHGETSESTANIESSEYVLRWKEFLMAPELENFLAETDLTLLFYPHYEMQSDIELMAQPTEHIKLARIGDSDVQDLLMESALLITDFSSVRYDFAFMDKPLISYQFDKEQYYGKHYGDKFFGTDDVFGPEVFTKQELMEAMHDIVERGFAVDEEYAACKSAFFAKVPDNSCEAAYQAIFALDRKNRK